MNYYQAITNRLSMGGEGMYIGVNGNQITSYTLKYECDAKGGDSDEGVSNTAGSSTSKNPSKVQPSSWFGAQLSPALLDLLIWTVRKTQAISRWVKRICFILDHLIWASLLVTAAVVMVTATLMVLLLTLFKALVVLISPSPTKKTLLSQVKKKKEEVVWSSKKR